MRKVIIDGTISLDGYFTSLSNEIEWLGFKNQEITWSKGILRRIATMMYGSDTYHELSQF